MEHDLPDSRLATTDEHGNRVFIHPEDIKGKWKTYRTRFYWFLIFLYLVLPWIYIDGKQWILLNIPQRIFTIFGVNFYGHDGPLLFFLAVGFVLTIAFITSIWGRVWCGWACPQTVFIDSIYRTIERLVEGKARQRKALQQAPWDFHKLLKRSIKWLLFTLVSLHIVHSFLGYFVGTHRLFWITLNSPFENWELFTTMLFLTAVILFDFGWFREQFCIIACPYGRFQSVAMDDDSMVVAYDAKRGEPRRQKGLAKDAEGSCINCRRCVKACPTGIDIREGTQLECIACTMCIDACDEIMVKLNQPTGLIRYTTENELKGKSGKKIKPRSLVYLSLIFILGVGLYTSLSLRSQLQMQIFRSSKESAFQEIKLKNQDPLIVNHLRVKLFKGKLEDHTYSLKLANPDLPIELTTPEVEFRIMKNQVEIPIFLKFSKEILNNGKSQIKINLEENNQIILTKEIELVGPFK